MTFFQELKRRNVFRVGFAYAVAAWVLLQVFDVIGDILDLPASGGKLILAMLVVGFFIALIVAWAYELTPEGVKRESEVDRSEVVTDRTGRKIDRTIIGLLVVAVLFLMWDKFLIDRPEPTTPSDQTDAANALIPTGAYDSIGVLPFVNITNDPDQDYFSDGIAEELLNALAKFKNLKVAARTSSFSLKGEDLDAIEIGEQLRVGTVLEGSVRKSGNRLRITAQLIETDNGYHLWSETYDREMTDVFAVQDEITEAIVTALKLHLETGEAMPATQRKVVNVEAYEKYLQGKHDLRRPGNEREALESFRAATDIDPEFAAAWAARAQAIVNLRETAFWGEIPLEEAHLLAQNSIDKALELDPRQAGAYVARGMLNADAYRYEEALADLENAIAINPSLAEAWTWRGRLLNRFGRIKESGRSFLKALELDPLHSRTAIFAAMLATEFYDPVYFDQVLEKSRDFPRIVNRLEMFRKTMAAPKSAEEYREIVSSLGDASHAQAQFALLALKEFDAARLPMPWVRYPQDYIMWRYISTNQLDKAEEQYRRLSFDRQQANINLEERSIMLVMQGACEEAIDTLKRAHNGELRIYGMVDPNRNRSNGQLALNRAYCLRRLDRGAEATEVIRLVRTYVDTLRENAAWGFAQLEAKLLILEGNTEKALDVLESAVERFELYWEVRYDPIISTLSSHPRFVALFDSIDRNIESLRDELGMPPASI